VSLTNPQQVGSFPVYGETAGKRVYFGATAIAISEYIGGKNKHECPIDQELLRELLAGSWRTLYVAHAMLQQQ